MSETAYDTYDVDPTKVEADIVNKWRDTNNGNVLTVLKRVEHPDCWLLYQEFQTAPYEFETEIKGFGSFRIEAVDLDTDTIADYIREEAKQLGEAESTDAEITALVDTLTKEADAMAEEAAEQWSRGVQEVLDDSAYNGVLGIDGTFVWVGHVEEAMHYEAKSTLPTLGIEDVSGLACGILKEALYEAVDKHRSRWKNPYAEYIGRLVFEPIPWRLRAIELQQQGGFPEKTAQVLALKEQGEKNSDIATRLDVSDSNVTQHLSRANRIVSEANWTVDNVDV